MVYIHEKTVEKSFNNGILYGLEMLKNYFSKLINFFIISRF